MRQRALGHRSCKTVAGQCMFMFELWACVREASSLRPQRNNPGGNRRRVRQTEDPAGLETDYPGHRVQRLLPTGPMGARRLVRTCSPSLYMRRFAMVLTKHFSLDPLPFEANHFDLVRICCIGLEVPEDSWQELLEVCFACPHARFFRIHCHSLYMTPTSMRKCACVVPTAGVGRLRLRAPH